MSESKFAPLIECQERRAAHRGVAGKRAGCRRCGLAVTDNRGRCPPGFWMTKVELAAWERGDVRYKDL